MQLVNQTDPNSDSYRIGSGSGQSKQDLSPQAVARENLRRYQYVKSRGHGEYLAQARRNENFYLGGGLQWDEAVRSYMETTEGRPASECNEILGAVNAAIGYQIANRMDVQFVPSSADANPQTAKVLDLVCKQLMEATKYRWHETQIFGDGLIAQRGYLDIRIELGDDMQAQLCIDTPDPMDVIPDPDAKTYDTKDWLDVTVTRWLTAAEIGDAFGPQAQAAIENMAPARTGDFGDTGDGSFDDGIWRNRFGDPRTATSEFHGELADRADWRYRIIDRQHFRHDWATVAVYTTGDVIDVSQATPETIAAAKSQGAIITQRRIKRVRWTVSAVQDILLKDEWSPFSTFTIIPFFPYFRRGRTRGTVDNAISPQETLNKAISQGIHIVNTIAHSGWKVPQNSLTNMDTQDLESKGAQNGLIIEFDATVGEPKEIAPKPMPTGMAQLIQIARDNIKAVTGINESMLGVQQADMSGVAIQSRQFAAQQQLAMPLDNLSRTRHAVAEKFLDFIQKFMPDTRVIRITDHGAMGLSQQSVTVNQPMPDGSVLHDLTLGKYDVVISDQPMQITFDNSQFEQIQALAKDFGYRVPPSVALRYSNLPDKATIAPLLEQANQGSVDPAKMADAQYKMARAAQAQATADLTRAKTAQTNVTAVYSATQAAAQAQAIPHLAPVADAILESSGFPNANPIPQDAGGGIPAPVEPLSPGNVPQVTQMPGEQPQSLRRMPGNTDPLTPAHPDRGVDSGIEGGH